MLSCITQKLKKICRKESVLFAQKNLIRFAIVQINSLVQENAIFSGKIKLRETASIFLIRASAANVEQYSSRKKSLRRTVQMSVPDELQIGAMQKEAAISRSRERIFTNIVYWLCSEIKKFARFCGSTEQILVHHKDGSGETESPNDALENLQVLC